MLFFSRANFYTVLGVGPAADSKEIKDKFYELSKKFHPDHNKVQIILELNISVHGTVYRNMYSVHCTVLTTIQLQLCTNQRFREGVKKIVADMSVTF